MIYDCGALVDLILIGENRCIQTSTCLTARMPITNTAWTALRLSPGLHNKREQAVTHLVDALR